MHQIKLQDEHPKMSGNIRSDFLEIINDFSSCLLKRKQSGSTFLPVSKQSQTIMDAWADDPAKKDDFLFEGSSGAKIFIVDSEGSFFQGDVGGLLAKILGAMKLTEASVFICNAQNTRSIHKKIKEISPKVIITLGSKAGQTLLNIRQPLGQFRGKFHEYCGIKVMPTYHPSFLLKNPDHKRQVWEDMKQVMAYAGLNHAP